MMMTFELTHPMRLEEFLQLKMRDEDNTRLGDRRQHGLTLIAGGPSYSFWIGDRCLAVMGVATMFERSCEAWIFCDKEIVKYPRELLEATKQAMHEIVEESDMVRLQAHCLADWLEANSFLRHLGFELEAMCRCFGPDLEDYNQYVRIEPWQQ